GNLLNFVVFRVLDEHDVFPAVIEPTDEDQFIKRRCPYLRRGRRNERKRISLPDFLIAIRFETRRNLVICGGNGGPCRRQQRQDKKPIQTGTPFTGSEHTSGPPRARG